MTGHGDDEVVIDTLHDWLRAGEACALVTVVRTWGSSPRPPGCLMAMNKAGKYVGSVSGGCIEEQLISRFRRGESGNGLPELIHYGVDGRDAARVGLPCGGRLELLLEASPDPDSIRQLSAYLRQGELVAREVDLRTGQVKLFSTAAGVEFEHSDRVVKKTFGPAWGLLIIGNGQIANQLGRMAQLLDYQVVICDPRDDYAAGESVQGVEYRRQMPDEAVNRIRNKRRTAVVTVAHDPRQDDLALTAALESDAFYIGALGSRRSSASRMERLGKLGYAKEQLQRIHGPVGVDIGSRKPGEIAVSILAQITAVRNGVSA